MAVVSFLFSMENNSKLPPVSMVDRREGKMRVLSDGRSVSRHVMTFRCVESLKITKISIDFDWDQEDWDLLSLKFQEGCVENVEAVGVAILDLSPFG